MIVRGLAQGLLLVALATLVSSSPGNSKANKGFKVNGASATKASNQQNVRRGKFLIGVGSDLGVNLPGLQIFPGVKYFTDKTNTLLPLLSNPSPAPIAIGAIIGLGAISAVIAALVSVSTMFIGRREDDEDEVGRNNPFRENGPATFPPLDYELDVADVDNELNDVDRSDTYHHPSSNKQESTQTADDYQTSKEHRSKGFRMRSVDGGAHQVSAGGRLPGTASPSGYGYGPNFVTHRGSSRVAANNIRQHSSARSSRSALKNKDEATAGKR